MQGRTHMIMGAGASLLVLPIFGYQPEIITTVVASIGALVCDMDHPKAMINQKILPIQNKFAKMLVYAGGGGFLIYKNLVFQKPLLTLIGMLLIMIGLSTHRGITHSLIGVSFICFVLIYSGKNIKMDHLIMAAIVGLISHPIADYFTKEGIRIFYPFSDKSYKFFFPIKTGGLIEYIINVAILVGVVNWFLKH